MNRFVSRVVWHGPYRTENGFKSKLESIETADDKAFANRVRLYAAVGRQKKLSIKKSQVLYIGMNKAEYEKNGVIKNKSKISDRSHKSLFKENRIRGLLNEYWFGEILTPFQSNDNERVVSNTESAYIYTLDPLRNEINALNIDFSYTLFSDFKTSLIRTLFQPKFQRMLFTYIDYENSTNKIFSADIKLKKSLIETIDTTKRRRVDLRDAQDKDCWRQRWAEQENTN